MTTQKPLRCLLAMLGTDVHSKGIRTLARLLRDHGLEVIYLGEHNTAEGIISAAIAEDADVIGLSYSTATYLHYTRELIEKMRDAGIDDIPVMLGGLIHPEDEAALAEMGVDKAFGPSATSAAIFDYLDTLQRSKCPEVER